MRSGRPWPTSSPTIRSCRLRPASTGASARSLVTAAQNGRVEIARLLVDAGADVNAGVPLWSPQGQALFSACAQGDLELAKLFLEAGANPNTEVESSGNCFSIMSRDDPEKVRELRELLIAHGGVPPEEEEVTHG